MRRLNGVDALLLYTEAPEIHMHTLKIGILDVSGLDGAFTFELFRRVAEPRLLALKPLRYQLVDIPLKLHHPMWVENPDIDFDHHIRRVSVPAPGGRRELDQVIGEIAGTPLDRSRPLWEMYVADGLAGDRVAIIHKVHHVLADGVASANQLGWAIQPEPPEFPAQPIRTEPRERTRSGLVMAAGRDHARQIRRLPKLLADTVDGVSKVRRRAKERGSHPELASNFAPPPTFINHVVSPTRRFATAPLALADVKETAKTLGVTINDVVLTTVAGALRELLLKYDGAADTPLIAGVPVSYGDPDRLAGNEFTYMTPSLAVHVDDPLERLRLTATATAIAKENNDLLGPGLIPSWLNFLPPAMAPPAFRWQSKRMESSMIFNLTVSNVPGPRERGSFGGAVISEIYSVGPLVAGSAMNVTVWSYVDQLDVSVLTDDQTTDDPHEVTEAIFRSFVALRSAAGLSDVLTEVSDVMPLAAATMSG
ncbi:wax ester/triacylglycerol synthase family O-acyltransferase [Mycobacterium sp. NPDC006124]|uniref:WS/DGAT/MGAT family O-acyltransferase n=1 Tax=Mycobacterium sp. NPDC006124 TaxID=3156729 RepID=UPI0033A2DE50